MARKTRGRIRGRAPEDSAQSLCWNPKFWTWDTFQKLDQKRKELKKKHHPLGWLFFPELGHARDAIDNSGRPLVGDDDTIDISGRPFNGAAAAGGGRRTAPDFSVRTTFLF